MTQTVAAPSKYSAKTCVFFNGNGVTFMKPPNIRAEENAIRAGFSIRQQMSTNVTRFLKRVNLTMSRTQAERHCATLNGTLAPLYNAEVIDELNRIGSSGVSSMHSGLNILAAENGSYHSLWLNGMVDWTSDAADVCPKYDGWSTEDWSSATASVNPGESTHIPGEANPTPDHFYCQYAGKNLAAHKATLARYTRGDFFQANAVNNNWQGDMYHGMGYDWFAVDLGELHAIKAVQWLARTGCCGYRNKLIDFLVGNTRPVEGQVLDSSQYTKCGHFPYQQTNGHMAGITCECWTIGQYIIMVNFHWAQQLQVSELAVYGVTMAEFLS